MWEREERLEKTPHNKKHSPLLFHTQRILTLCTARLADVARLWSSGDLAAAGLDARAVQRLVCALFEDTPTRRSTLAAIK